MTAAWVATLIVLWVSLVLFAGWLVGTIAAEELRAEREQQQYQAAMSRAYRRVVADPGVCPEARRNQHPSGRSAAAD